MMYIDDQWCRMGLVFRILQLCGDIAHHSTTVRTLRIFHCLFQASSEDSQCISSFGVGVTQELIWGDAVMHLELRSKVFKRVKRVRLSEVQISAQICGALQSALRTPHRGCRHENMQIFTGSATSNYNTLMVIYLDESSQKDLSYLVHRISDWWNTIYII